MRINERIRISEVRLVDQEGTQVGVVPTFQALEMAKQAGMDLVEVDPNGRPPVCRIMDFGKFKYRQKKRTHKSHQISHAGELKELRLRPKIDEHDMIVKVKKAQEFIQKRRRVLVSLMFKGREIQHRELGLDQLKKFVELVGDTAKVEAPVHSDGRRITVTLAPK